MALTDNAIRKTYISRIDGVKMPYMLYVPSYYRESEPYPVIACLHGAGGNEYSGIGEGICRIAEDRGYILISTNGRGLTFYDGLGDIDFWDVLERVKKRYHIDEDRIYVIGGSMGGTGAYRLAARYPDKFAAAIPICGWADYHWWYRHWYPSVNAPKEIPEFRRPLLERASALYIAENLMHLPMYIMHGAKDGVVEIGEGRNIYKRLRTLGYEVVFKEYLRSYHSGFGSKWSAVFDWIEGKKSPSDWIDGKEKRSASAPSLKKRVVNPKVVVYKTNTPKYNQAYWVQIDRLTTTNKFAKIHAEIKDRNIIRVRASNIEAYTLKLNDALVDFDKPLTIKTGSKISYQGPCQKEVAISLLDDDKIATPVKGKKKSTLTVESLRKRPGVQGPIGDVFDSKFIIVPGKSPEDKAEAERLVRHYNAWIVPKDEDGNPIGSCALKDDEDVTSKDIDTSNLIFFGRPSSNEMVKRIAAKLPITITADAIKIGKKRFKGKNIGMRMIYPNPLNPDRYVMINVGHFPQRIKDMEGMPWLLPDYVVFDETKECSRSVHPDWNGYDARVESGEINDDEYPEDAKPVTHLPDCFLAAGFFDDNWEVEE